MYKQSELRNVKMMLSDVMWKFCVETVTICFTNTSITSYPTLYCSTTSLCSSELCSVNILNDSLKTLRVHICKHLVTM